MWPFRKKQRKASEPCAKQLAIDAFRAWRPIGASFIYLGRECVVSRHYAREFYPGVCMSVATPGLSADYADDHGVIHSISFSWAESEAIMAAQP